MEKELGKEFLVSWVSFGLSIGESLIFPGGFPMSGENSRKAGRMSRVEGVRSQDYNNLLKYIVISGIPGLWRLISGW